MEGGLIILLITTVSVVWAEIELLMQLMKLYFMVEVVCMVHDATRLFPILNEASVAEAELGKSVGKVIVKVLPEGKGFLF